MTETKQAPYPTIDLSPCDGPLSCFKVKQSREILNLALPTVLAMLSHTLMWTFDTALLGHYSSVHLAAASLGGLITWTAYSLFNNLARINGTFVSQAHGKNDDEAIGGYTWQGIYVSVACGLILQLAGYLSYHVLPWTHNPPEVVDLAYDYIKWRSASAVFTIVGFCLMGFFQGRRQVMIPMWAGIIANGANVILDFWLIYGWEGFEAFGRTWLAVRPMGVEGAAIATSLGTLLGLLYQVVMLFGPREHRRRFQIHRPRAVDWQQIKRIVKVGSPAAVENFIDMGSFTVFCVFIGTTGATALAANQITVHLLSFAFMPMWGLTTAGAVLVGNWIGAGRHDQAAAYARQVYKVGLYYMTVLGLLFLAFRPHLFKVFTNDPAVLALGPGLVMIIALFQFPDGMRMVAVGVLQGAGDTLYSMLACGLVFVLGFVPTSYWLIIKQGASVPTAWLGASIFYGLVSVILYMRFRSGAWKTKKIFGDEATTEI